MSRLGSAVGPVLFQSGAAPIALGVDLEDGGMMDESIDRGGGGGLVGKDSIPLGKGQIGGEEDGALFVAIGDQFEEDGAFFPVAVDAGEIVEDEEVELVATREQSIEIEIALSDLHFLDEAGGSGEEHLEALAHEGEADGGGEVALADAGGPEDEEVGSLADPAVFGGEGLNACFGRGRDEAEIESFEILAGEEFGLPGMSVDAPVVPFGQFEFGEGEVEFGRRPTFLVGALSQDPPLGLDGGQSQLGKHDGKSVGIDGLWRCRADGHGERRLPSRLEY